MNNICLHVHFIYNNMNKVFVCFCLLSFYVSLFVNFIAGLLACFCSKNISQLPSASDMMINCFTELGRVCRYDSSSASLRNVR